MKKLAIIILTILFCVPTGLSAAGKINLTPVPYSMTEGSGSLILPAEFDIETGNLPDSVANEARKFATHLAYVTGYTINVKSQAPEALIKASMYDGSDKLGSEGYTLDITTEGITLSANTSHGFYYAFQSIKKMLPACVMAGVKDDNITEFSLPVVSITDRPRFSHRGFMLDVSRHYFDLAQLKRMIDVMSYYKMNRFHWHLTDDQGWRIEIKKYPRLTTVGATRSNSWSVDPIYGGYYTNEPYGPYFFTQDEARELVKYAKERHIEIIPEIEFPGHTCAVLAAYPEFSCTPDGSHSVQVNGGIYSDVLNVANPAAVQFAKDVLDEIIDIFPYSQIHIGGDECPTSAWNNNAECQALMAEKGFSNIRELQSYFVRQLADYAAQKERSVIMWNESLSANGTNVDLIKETGGTMMCWENGKVQSTALQAAKLGMNSIITPWGPYYINRKQSTDPSEPVGAGNGNDNLQATYEYVPIPTSVPIQYWKYYVGVQGTFWCEHVQSKYLLEYLALPRLMAIAETGWTPNAKKNFDDFCERITADSVLLNYNNYDYGRHYMGGTTDNEDKIMPETSTEDSRTWYRIVTGATDSYRAGRCIELLHAASEHINTGNAQTNRLWNATVLDDSNEYSDYQLWALMEDPDAPGKYAIINKAKPNGSVNSTPTATNNTARWDYDETTRHYDFILGEAVYTQNGNYYRYSIRSQKAASGMYMNMAGAGQDYSINMWSDPTDGNGGVWEFRPLNPSEEATIDYPAAGSFVRIMNNVEKFRGWALSDDGKATVTVQPAEFAADVWEIVSAEETSDGQNITLRNVATGRYLSGTSYPITLGTTAATYKNVYNTRTGDFSILANGNALFPMPQKATTNPNTLNVGGIYPQGSAWRYDPAYQITYECYDQTGALIGTYYKAATKGESHTCNAPQIKNMTIKSYESTGTAEAPVIENVQAHATVKVTYERSAYSVTIECRESRGGLIQKTEASCPIGDSYTVNYPQLDYFTLLGGTIDNGSTITPTEDCTIVATYSTEGLCGFKAIGNIVTEVEDGRSYLLFNNKNDSSRNGLLNVAKNGNTIYTDNSATSGSPAFIWTLNEASSGKYHVSNEYGCYVPTLTKGSANKAAASGDSFRFTLNSDGTSFSILGTNGYYWNGNSDHSFTGWTDAHPFIVYDYVVEPYFSVGYTCVDEEGTQLLSSSRYIAAGESYTLTIPTIDNHTYTKTEGGQEGANTVTGNMNIIITYSRNDTGITDTSIGKNRSNGIHDLTGRKIENVTHPGIYIVNGHKVIIKQ